MAPRALHLLSRLLSLLLAAGATLVTLLAPRLIAEESSRIPHGPLALGMLGVCCAWVHAFGLSPRSRILKLSFSPLIAWPLIALGAAGILSSRHPGTPPTGTTASPAASQESPPAEVRQN